MSIRPREDLKSTATSLAKLLSSDRVDKKAAGHLLEQLGYGVSEKGGAGKYDSPPKSRKSSVPAGSIGIYSPETIDGEIHYQRNIAFKDKWPLCADVATIPPKGPRKRIVLLGESVARGYLLDPGYTPAKVLDAYLNGNSSPQDEIEVIDLAETNLTMEGLKQRYQECLALDPDLVIFFAGNNWRADMELSIVRSPENIKKMMEALLRHGGIAGLKGVIEEIFANLVDSFLSYVHQLAAPAGMKVVFLIPEYNLLDCRSTSEEQFVTKLMGEGTRKWVTALKEARATFANGHIDEAENHAVNMIALDPTNPLGFEIMADCQLKRGNQAAARNNLELARDTALFFRTNSKPRVYSVVRKTILEKAAAYQLTVVDLSAVFGLHLKNKIPGRTLFFDYCHLTVEGIQVAMEALAKQVAGMVLKEQTPLQNYPGPAYPQIYPDRQVSALAHLLAAIHNAHWGQSYEILYYHCTCALRLSDKIAMPMVHYCDMMSRQASNVLCRSFEILASKYFKLDRHMYALRNPRNYKQMDLDLVNAMVEALKDTGLNITTPINELRAEEHGVLRHPLNLLRSYYHSSSYGEYNGTKTAYFQAREPVSRFFVVARKGIAIRLSATLRIPQAAPGIVKAALYVNDVPIGEIGISDQWSDHTIIVAGDVCSDGVNIVTIQWPIPADQGSSSELFAASDTSFNPHSLLDAAFYVLGEIMHFKAQHLPLPSVHHPA